MGNVLLSLITFLSAFLLFQIELIIAKIFLPNYGGSYLVWGACLVFFQAVLLLGYWFAHAATSRFPIEKYRFIHLALLAAPLLFFPGRNLDITFGQASLPLVLDIFLRLGINIGLVFFVLSTISIVTQVWLSGSKLTARNNPYFLYAVSNLGSFAALFSYPFFVELNLDITQQLTIWRSAYFALIVLNACAFFLIPVTSQTEARANALASAKVPRDVWVRWLLLGAGGSMVFMSVNNLITYELPPVPLFWIFPLSIYLFSFVLNFKKTPWCPAWINDRIHMIIGIAATYYFFLQKIDLPAIMELLILLSLLFCLCMFCQNQLIRSKPSRQDDLTAFYFIISLGSFLGGVFTTWIVPIISNSMVEYLWSLIVISIAVLHDPGKPLMTAYAIRMIVYFNIFLTAWAACFAQYHSFGVALLFTVVYSISKELAKARHAMMVTLIILVVGTPSYEKMWDRRATPETWSLRNYYGIHTVVDTDKTRWLYHGFTLHGAQSLVPEEELWPLTYYGPKSGMAEIMGSEMLHFKNLALIGLGAGTFTVFTTEDQQLDIFELDPDIQKIASERFTFLKNCKAKWRMFIGDARVSIEKVNDRVYDLIMMDAFGGDAIPIHLVTLEALEKYRQRLSPDGVVLIHVSNRYVQMAPALARVAEELGTKIVGKYSRGDAGYQSSEWIVLTWSQKNYEYLLTKGWEGVRAKDFAGLRPWTDRYSSVLQVIRGDYLINSFKNFRPLYWP